MHQGYESFLWSRLLVTVLVVHQDGSRPPRGVGGPMPRTARLLNSSCNCAGGKHHFLKGELKSAAEVRVMWKLH